MECLKSFAATVPLFFKKYRVVIIGQGIYASLSWLYDNLLWWAVELRYGAKGIAAMMIGAVLINFSILFYYRNKKVSWLGWDQGAAIVKEKEQWLRKNSGRICLVAMIIIASILHVPDEIPWQIIPVAIAVVIVAIIMALFLRFRIAEDIFALFFLSIVEDSFIATAYLRHGRMDGLKFRVVVLFFASSMVSTIYWAVRNGIIVEAIIRPLIK